MPTPSAVLRSSAGTTLVPRSSALARIPARASTSPSLLVPAPRAVPALALPPPRPKSVTTVVGPTGPPPPSSQFEPAIWFNTPPPRYGEVPGPPPSKPPTPDPNQAKLGKTLRILQQRLPTLLQKPLPQEILAPNITLHLFPSTHPHLPVVSGRVAYVAALWTSPIAWNRIPLISNVKIEIMSERMTTQPYSLAAHRQGCRPEQLVVKWKTIGGAKNWGLRWVGTALPEDVAKTEKKEFTGMFIFEFDAEGRVLSHTIENMQDGGERENVSKVVGLTDWLLGGMRSPSPSGAAGFMIEPSFMKIKSPRRKR